MFSHESAAAVRRLPDGPAFDHFSERLRDRLAAGSAEGAAPDAPADNRVRALLLTSGLVEELHLRDFAMLLSQRSAARVALADLLDDTGLAAEAWLEPLALLPSPGEPRPVSWLSLALLAYAWKAGIVPDRLDSSIAPVPDSPADQVLKHTGRFVRRQLHRTATDRDRLAARLAPDAGAPSLSELPANETLLAPLPPHFRPPVPERYPEMARETLQISEDEVAAAPPLGSRLVIEADDLEPRPVVPSAAPLPGDRSAGRTPPSPLPDSAVVMPATAESARPRLTVARPWAAGRESTRTTKLRVTVHEHPHGTAIHGVQVRVTCRDPRAHVAGTTDAAGRFVCELPVKPDSGPTYEVEVTWPRDLGGLVERKAITLNPDRTEFALPFFHQVAPR